MTNGINEEYTITNVSIIAIELSMKPVNVIIALEHLNKINIIKINEVKFDKVTPLHIAIIYNNESNIGYRAIPIDYVRTLLPTMTSTEWGILSTLLVNYNYFQATQSTNMSNGESVYSYIENHYSFPTQMQLSNSVGVSDKTVRTYLNKLESNPYKIMNIIKGKKYSVIENNKTISRQEVNKYYIPLLDRIDYIYQNIYNVKDSDTTKRKDTVELLKKDGFGKVSSSKDNMGLITKDYIIAKYGTVMKEYEKIINDRDTESYKTGVKYLTKY